METAYTHLIPQLLAHSWELDQLTVLHLHKKVLVRQRPLYHIIARNSTNAGKAHFTVKP